MPLTESEGQAIRRQLEKVLGSSGFSRNERLSRFLRFVVEGQLNGKDHELKESVIAVEVFGRRPDFDSRLDPVVRTEAARLRARLNEYYLQEGKDDAIVIELPKGGYQPRFRGVGEEQPVRAAAAPPARSPWPPKWPSWVGLAAALVIALAVAGSRWVFSRGAPIPIAVLPLENTSGDRANDYFADGLTDELIRNLSIIDGLIVRSRTSSFSLKGQPHNVRDAGNQLQADYILEGSVLRGGQTLRIDVQLVRVRDDATLWSRRFDRELTDVFAVQDEIALAVVNNLRLKLGGGRRRYETSPEAYDLYLRARAMPDQRGHARAMKAAAIYRQVIAKDARFAPAYAGLSAAYAASSAQGFRDDHGDELVQMRAAAESAIRLDPLLAEAHDAMAMVYMREGKWAQSEASFRRAIELELSNSETYVDLSSWLLLPLGRIDEALSELRKAEKADPLSPFIQERLASMLIVAGRYEDAAARCASEPECMARVRLGQGRIDEAIQILYKYNNPPAENELGRKDLVRPRYLGYAYARAGRREDAEKIALEVVPNAYSEALIYAGLGDRDRTFKALDRVAELGAARIGQALNFPEFALLRSDPRVKVLRKRVGLPE
jgi:TolB-like protein/Flp pilus assembly protein TadD